MIDKNWIRPAIAAIFVLFGVIYIEKLNSDIKLLNMEVSKLSVLTTEIAKSKARVEEIMNFSQNSSGKDLDRANEILINLNKKLSNDKMKSSDFFTENEIPKILNHISSKEKIVINTKSDKIKIIRSILSQRKFVFRLVVILSTLFIILEILLFIINSKKVKRYLKNLSYKKYNFETKLGLSPFQNGNIKEIEEVRRNLKILDQAIGVTLKGYGIDETIREIYYDEKFKEYLKFDRIGFATILNDVVVAEISYSFTKNLKLNKGYSTALKESKSLMEVKASKDVRIINDLQEHYNNNPNSESTKLILDEGFKSSLTAPVISENNEVVGFLFFSSIEKNSFNKIDKERIRSITNILGYVLSKHMLIDDLITNTAVSFVKLVEGKDPETSNHLERMAMYSRIIAEELNEKGAYSEEIDFLFIEGIYKFAALHDIGKVGVPDNILLKPGKLTKEEFEIMKGHSSIGAKVLSDFDNNLSKYERGFFNLARRIAVSHHEKWDGSGYPNGISGKRIPLAARIVSIADVFDALASKRVYKEAFPFDECVEIIKSLSGTSFDPEVVDAFIRSRKKILAVYDRLKDI